MTAVVVVDASMAVKWVLPEEGHAEAMRLLERYRNEDATLIAPHLLLAEAGNTFWKLARRGILTEAQATAAFHHLLENSPILMESSRIASSALQLALAHRQTLYDCLYLALALDQQCDLVTADRRFFGGIHLAFPFVQLLGNLD